MKSSTRKRSDTLGAYTWVSQMMDDWHTQRETAAADVASPPPDLHGNDTDEDEDELPSKESFFPLLSRNARHQLKVKCGVTMYVAQSMMTNKMWSYSNWPGAPVGPSWIMCTDHVKVVHCQGNHESILRGPLQGGDLDIIVPVRARTACAGD